MEHYEDRYDDSLILTERQLSILQALIEEFIATAQPVSSMAVAQYMDIHASSATIRNEMARLEELGLLLQPHTSAGRIPTDLGYRVYVRHVVMQQRRQRQRMTLPLFPQDPGIEATCRLLGELTKYTTLAVLPGWELRRLQHIELAPVGSDQLLVMLITDDQQVLHSLSTVSERPEPARLRQVNDLLNEHFTGKPLTELTPEALAHAMTQLPHPLSEFYRQAPALVRRGLEQERSTARIYVEGTTHIFEQQEFSDMPKLRALMEALHEESVFEQLFARSLPGEIQVSIGAENPHPGLEDCAIVFTSYHISEHTTGRFGVLGPKRMKYRQVIGTMDAIVHNLDQRMHKPE